MKSASVVLPTQAMSQIFIVDCLSSGPLFAAETLPFHFFARHLPCDPFRDAPPSSPGILDDKVCRQLAFLFNFPLAH